jgi:hypothetical protein
MSELLVTNSSKVKDLCPIMVGHEDFNSNWSCADFTQLGETACAEFMFYMGNFFAELYIKHNNDDEFIEQIILESNQLKLASMAHHERKNIIRELNRDK